MLAISVILAPVFSMAKIFISTQITSGHIVSISDENEIELDDGLTYLPAKKGFTLSIKPGQQVSLRYYTDQNYQRIYIDYKLGKNSIKPVLPPKRDPNLKF